MATTELQQRILDAMSYIDYLTTGEISARAGLANVGPALNGLRKKGLVRQDRRGAGRQTQWRRVQQ